MAKETVKSTSPSQTVNWNPWIGVLLVLTIYVVSQVVGLVIMIYPLIMRWSVARANNWLSNNTFAQFAYLIVVEGFTVISVLFLLKYFKTDRKAIGLRRPRWKDLLWAVVAAPIYYVIYILVVGVASSLDKGLNVSEGQNVGFNQVHGAAQLIVTFISLVILPPIAEEILVRGFLYSSLKKGLPQLVAALLTSIIFASAHLPEGTAGLLWIGFIDTFILSMVLVYLREKTGGLYSGMVVHALKNGVAFFVLYVGSIYAFHIF